MNKRYAIFDDAGDIKSIFIGSDELVKFQGLNHIEVGPDVSDATHYIDLENMQPSILDEPKKRR
ncbi:hypothetical protein [Salinicola peritrichatus]|uniref:hypothetical protein n=1 Tax=Salinicola peritrichatus TaxID=1267424 RepID=UPI000DA10E4D|nr:hypothetical protein [Salinicola peritrichatus]